MHRIRSSGSIRRTQCDASIGHTCACVFCSAVHAKSAPHPKNPALLGFFFLLSLSLLVVLNYRAYVHSQGVIEAGWRAAVGAHQDDTTVYAGADIRLDTEVSAMSFPLVLRAPVEVLRNLLDPVHRLPGTGKQHGQQSRALVRSLG